MIEVIRKFVNEIDKPHPNVKKVVVIDSAEGYNIHVYFDDPNPTLSRSYSMKNIKQYYHHKVRDYIGAEVSGVYFIMMR